MSATNTAAVPLAVERRKHPRYSLTGRLPVRLVDENNQEYSFMLVDASKLGLGIILDSKVTRGMILRLVPAADESDTEQHMLMKVVWCAQTTQEPPVFRGGLLINDQQQDFLDYLDQFPSVFIEDRE